MYDPNRKHYGCNIWVFKYNNSEDIALQILEFRTRNPNLRPVVMTILNLNELLIIFEETKETNDQKGV